MKSIIIFFSGFVLIGLQFSNAQSNSTNNKGAFFFQIGYNRSAYTKADVVIKTNDYQATLKGTRLSDNEDRKDWGGFFSSSSPQFNMKIGYYIVNKWALTLNYNRYNTFFVNHQPIKLSGHFSPNHSPFSSTYQNESFELDRNKLNIRQRNGMNYFAIGVQRADEIYQSRNAAFSFQTVYGVKIGGLWTKVDYTFNGHTRSGISSFSGFGLSANLGLRFDFVQHIFLQLGVEGGLLNQNNIKISSNSTEKAKQVVGYFSPSISLGFSIYTGLGGGCGTCPSW